MVMQMKKVALLLIIILLLTGCSRTTGAPNYIDVNAEKDFYDRIIEIEGLTVNDVQAIWRFDDSSPPDIPTRIVYREKDLQQLLVAMQAVRLTEPLLQKPTVAPGDYWKYRIYLFNGKTIEIHFSSSHVNSQGSTFSYQNSAVVQQTMDEIHDDPNLLKNDAYDTIEKVIIATATGEHTVVDQSQMDRYIRMFHWMTVTGRSHETLADGITYTFHHKDGKDIVLQYKGNLLATEEGTFQVEFNTDYLVTEQTD